MLTVSYASVVFAVPWSSGDASFGRMFTSCIDVSWDCGVVAAEDDVVKMPSSSRERKGKDPDSADRRRGRELVRKGKAGVLLFKRMLI